MMTSFLYLPANCRHPGQSLSWPLLPDHASVVAYEELVACRVPALVRVSVVCLSLLYHAGLRLYLLGPVGFLQTQLLSV